MGGASTDKLPLPMTELDVPMKEVSVCRLMDETASSVGMELFCGEWYGRSIVLARLG